MVRQVGEVPSVGSNGVTGVGQPLYVRFDYQINSVRVARLAEAVREVGGKGLNAGYLLMPRDPSSAWFCSPDHDQPRGVELCFQDTNRDSLFDKVRARGYDWGGSKKARIAYEFKSYPIGGNTEGYRRELLYQGVGGGILRITYREYLDDFVRPAFSQDLTYDLNPEGPTEISFRSARFRVHEANNNEIRYEVQAGL